MSSPESKLPSVRELWPLVALCLLLSTRWMLAETFPGTVSTVSSESCAALVAAAGWLLLGLRRQTASAASRPPAGKLTLACFAGGLLFAGLHPVLLFPDVALKNSDQMVSFSLTPIVIAVALVASGDLAGGLTGSDLVPGLAAVTGLLLILPQPSFASYAAVAVLLLTPVCVGVSTVWLRAPADSPGRGLRAGAASAGAALVFGLLSVRSPRSAPTLAATALDLLALVLTLLALQRAGPQRFAAQFTAVPLVLLLEGLLFTRILPDWRQTGGLVLLLLAAVLLFRRPRSSEQEPSLHLLT